VLVQARAADITLEFENTDTVPAQLQDTYIVADKHKLEQVVRNLVSNALKFTPKDGTVTIRVFLRESFKIASSGRTSRPDLTLFTKRHAVAPHSPVQRLRSLVDDSIGVHIMSNPPPDSAVTDSNQRDAALWLVVQVTDTGAGISLVRMPEDNCRT